MTIVFLLFFLARFFCVSINYFYYAKIDKDMTRNDSFFAHFLPSSKWSRDLPRTTNVHEDDADHSSTAAHMTHDNMKTRMRNTKRFFLSLSVFRFGIKY